jgi:hypothetical protein
MFIFMNLVVVVVAKKEEFTGTRKEIKILEK